MGRRRTAGVAAVLVLALVPLAPLPAPSTVPFEARAIAAGGCRR